MVLNSPDWTNIRFSFILLIVNLFRHPTLIVLPRSNDNVYICLFVHIEIKTWGWHIQQPGVVFENYLISAYIAQKVESLTAENTFIFNCAQVRIPSMLSFFFFVFIASLFHLYPLSINGKQF